MREERIAGDDYSLKDLFDGSITYSVDYYQREYAWSEGDVRTLVEDLYNEYIEYSKYEKVRRRGRQKHPPYFLGPFVYYQDPNGSRFLVDGQQRFTTLHLIFIMTRRLLDATDAAQEAEMLNRVIMTYDDQGRPQYRIAIGERIPLLNAFHHGLPYERPLNATLSVRNMAVRAQEIKELLEQLLDAEMLPDFVVWMLNQVVMVGIRAPSQDNAYRIFETMNDRGARLTSVDLLKSFLLANAHGDETSLNDRWRRMLGELTTARDDHDAPGRFIKAALTAKYAGTGGPIANDVARIDAALNVWVQQHKQALGLTDGRAFFRFVDELIELATLYRTFLAATRTRDGHNALEAICFNEANGMEGQMIAILAAVRHDDPLSVAKAKASLIAYYIDRWYVLRVVDDLPVQQHDLDELMARLIVPLRTCRIPSDVATVLDKEISSEDVPLKAFGGFGMRGNNSHQVRYLLARITAYVAEKLGRPNEIDRYLNADRAWQIEHIFADHIERHPEISDPLVFRGLRNRLGLLVLLPKRDNNSVNDRPYATKIKTYSRQNDLAAILNPGHRESNPTLRDFAKERSLEGLFRPFPEQVKLADIASVRQELYLRLSQEIWDPVRLGISKTAPPTVTLISPTSTKTGKSSTGKSSTASGKKLLSSNIGKLIRAGALQPGEKLVGTHAGTDYWASVEDDGAIILTATGARYTRINDAAKEVRQKSSKGTEFWHKELPEGKRKSLQELLNSVT